jgi:predicted small lipoprotein YifL
MRALRWVVALLVVLGLTACGSHKDKIMPNVESSPSSEATSTQPSPTQPAADATITAENNQDFAALLADPNGDCDNNTNAFAKKYWDSTIEFDGKIAGIASHNGDTYVQDVLVYDGKAATAFQFNGVTIQPGGHAPAALGLPANSQPLAEGDKVHIVAKVDDFNQTQCLFHLAPVSTKIIS